MPARFSQQQLLRNDTTSLLNQSDALYVVETKQALFDEVMQAFRLGKHVFIEQLSLFPIHQIEQFVNSSKEANVKCLVGCVEFSNPTLHTLNEYTLQPLLIESQHHLSFSNQHSPEMILDEILKDILLILSLIKSDIKRFHANGMNIMSDRMDLANARLEFSNGCVANLTVSFNAQSPKSTLIIYEEKRIIELDFEQHRAQEIIPSPRDNKHVQIHEHTIEKTDAFEWQLQNFRDSIDGNTEPFMVLTEGYEKMELAHRILKKINSFGNE